MLKNNKGISLITLILTIIVILILTAIFLSTGLDSIFEAKNSKNANEIAQLKSAVSDRFNSHLKNEDTVTLVGKLAKNTYTSDECISKIISTLDFEKSTDEEKNTEKNKISNNISRDYEKYVMIIEAGDMAQLGLENYSKTNRYIVDYYTGMVYGPIAD